MQMILEKPDFEIIRKFIHKISGINLGDEKEYLVRQRLEPILKQQGFKSFHEFSSQLGSQSNQNLRDQIIIAITTNETSFFRDGHPYESLMGHVIPALVKIGVERKQKTFQRRGAKVRILSAGASTGQEPYSLSMMIYEFLQANPNYALEHKDFSIVATDVSSRVLAKAMAGEYTDLEIGRGLSDLQKETYFMKEDGKWVIQTCIRENIEFRRVNFIEPFAHLGAFDLILCRNVMIYFDNEMKKNMLNQFHHMLFDEGYLMLGSTENLYGLEDNFESQHIGKSVFYHKAGIKGMVE